MLTFVFRLSQILGDLVFSEDCLLLHSSTNNDDISNALIDPNMDGKLDIYFYLQNIEHLCNAIDALHIKIA